MRLLGWLSLAMSILGLVLTNTACRPANSEVPGTSAGTFAVTETLTSNGCTGGFDPDATLAYSTDVRVQGEIAYWHRGDTPIASGTYASGHFHFIAQADIQAYGTDAGPGSSPGCSLRQTETIDGMLALGPSDAGSSDAGSSDAAAQQPDAATVLDASIDAGPDAGVHSTGFVGTDTIQISVTPGSDCSLIFAQNGGPFPTLPCTAVYDMSATAN